jgi:uncharacterized Zn-binding protein involved in type VI secretion
MRKFKLCLVFIVALLVAAPLLGGVSLAEDTYTVQYITTVAGSGLIYLNYLQGISGFTLNSFSDSGLVNASFKNVTVNGIYNRAVGIGSFRNQGSVALINVEPDMQVSPVNIVGQSYSQGNQVTLGDYNYAVKLNFNNFGGSGLMVLDMMAGSFCNQFTSLTFNMGKNAIPQSPISTIFGVSQATAAATVASLSNKQMQAMIATADNDFKVQGKQSAVATMQGSPDFHGISAVTLSAGVNNLVSHNVSVNFDTAK